MKKLFRKERGAALVEYGLVVAGVALVAAAAVAILGHKTSQMVGTVSAVLPGVHAADNGPMLAGQIIETTDPANGPIALNAQQIVTNQNTERLGNNLLGAGNQLGSLVTQPNP